jgi:hypothetical protein
VVVLRGSGGEDEFDTFFTDVSILDQARSVSPFGQFLRADCRCGRCSSRTGWC